MVGEIPACDVDAITLAGGCGRVQPGAGGRRYEVRGRDLADSAISDRTFNTYIINGREILTMHFENCDVPRSSGCCFVARGHSGRCRVVHCRSACVETVDVRHLDPADSLAIYVI